MNSEIEVGEKWRRYANAWMVIFAVAYALLFPGLMQYIAYLGPGLGDDWSLYPFLQVAQNIYGHANHNWAHPLFLGFLLLCVVNIIFTAVMIIMGYLLYPKAVGKPYPVQVLFTYFSLNALCTIGIGAIHVLSGLIAVLLGYDLMSGLTFMGNLLDQVRDLAQQVPTLIDMPGWLAFFVLNMVGGFFHYWFHRLAHESRVLWLLFHRTHHMTPELIQPSTQAVFNSFPFSLFAAVPYVLIFSVIGKLISADSLLSYLIIYKLLSAFSNMWSHQTALYQWAQGQWWIRMLSIITSEGVYHYLHHSADACHNNPRGNTINIGGGLFFFWDKVFGTFVPVTPQRPRVGLQGIAAGDMTTNPMRLAFAGIAQVLYELNHNRSFKAWFMILFGPSDYVPVKSKEYVVRE